MKVRENSIEGWGNQRCYDSLYSSPMILDILDLWQTADSQTQLIHLFDSYKDLLTWWQGKATLVPE